MSFVESRVEFSIHLHPSRLSNIKLGIQEQINQFLCHYSSELNGVVISYSDLQLQNTTGKIFYDRPHIHFKVRCKMVVLQCLIGQRIIGTVNHVGLDHITLLFHGAFPVSISHKSIPAQYTYDTEREVWWDTRVKEAQYIQSNNNSNNANGSSVKHENDSNSTMKIEDDADDPDLIAAQQAIANNKPLTKKQKKKLERKQARQEMLAQRATEQSNSDEPVINIQPGVISVGTQIKFEITGIHSTDSYFSLHGSLLPSDTGIIPGRGYLPSGVLAQLKLQQDEQQQQFSLEGQSYDQVHTENVVDVKPVVKQEIVVEDEDEETIVANGSNESSLTPAKPKKLSAKELKKAAKAEEKKAKMEERIAKQKAEGTFVEKTADATSASSKKRKGDEEATTSNTEKKKKIKT